MHTMDAVLIRAPTWSCHRTAATAVCFLLLLLFQPTISSVHRQVNASDHRESNYRRIAPDASDDEPQCGKARAPVEGQFEATDAFPCQQGREHNRNNIRERERITRSIIRDRDRKQLATRIAGGYFAADGEFPSYVQLRLKNRTTGGVGWCGGALITEDWIMTAAHCVLPGTERIRARAGFVDKSRTGNMQTRYAAGACRMPKFRKGFYDVALVQVTRSFELNSHVQPVCLMLDQQSPAHRWDAQCFAVGMGRWNDTTKFPADKLVALPVKRNKCYNPDETTRGCYMASDDRYWGSPCHGDSGGAIYCWNYCTGRPRQVAVGVVSWTYTAGCFAEPPQLTGFADLHKLRRELNDLIDSCSKKLEVEFKVDDVDDDDD